jgi:hypothetical protein
MNGECVYATGVKLKNKRIEFVVYNDPKGEMVLQIHTKRLYDFKTREIIETNVFYGMESALIIYSFMDRMFRDGFLLNKHFPGEKEKTIEGIKKGQE